jgi:hypothetical protein
LVSLREVGFFGLCVCFSWILVGDVTETVRLLSSFFNGLSEHFWLEIGNADYSFQQIYTPEVVVVEELEETVRGVGGFGSTGGFGGTGI